MYRLMAQKGYPWTVDLHVLYDLSADGLTVTVTATNLSSSPAPFAQGAHPYLTVGGDGIDGWELTLPAASRLIVDVRKIPAGHEEVAHSSYDFRAPRPLKGISLDTAFTDLTRAPDGRAEVLLHNPGADRGVSLWMDAEAPLGAGLHRRRPRRPGPDRAGRRADDRTAERVPLRRGPRRARPRR